MPIYSGKVSVVRTKTGKVALVQDSEGNFELPRDIQKLFKTCVNLAKQHQLVFNVFTPEGEDKSHQLFVMARRGYDKDPSTRPYFALLPDRGNNTSSKVVKLA